MPKRKSATASREVSFSKFNRTTFVDLVSSLYQVLEVIEDDALRLQKSDMYEIYLFMFGVNNDVKKMKYATKEMLTKTVGGE